MAMYTALFGEVTLKEPYTYLIDKTEDGRWEFQWDKLRADQAVNADPRVVEFLEDQRHTSLDAVSSTYFEEYDFDEYIDLPQNTNGDCKPPVVYDASRRTVFLCTDIVNYTGTINRLLQVLPLIATTWELYELYEENKWDLQPDKHSSRRSNDGTLINKTMRGDRLHDWQPF